MKFAVVLVPLLWITQIGLASATTYGQFQVSPSGHIESVTKTGGNAEKGNKYNAYETVKKSGKSKKHDEEKANKGEHFKELKKIEDEEKGGKKKKHFSEGHHESSHSNKGGSKHGLKYASGAKKKKDNFEKGFREKYHKDELKHHHSFFSSSHEDGDYNIYGKKGTKHASFVAAKGAQDSQKKVESKSQHAKKSKKSGGHNASSKKGHRSSKDSKSNYANGESNGKKGGKKGGKQYGYKSSTK